MPLLLLAPLFETTEAQANQFFHYAVPIAAFLIVVALVWTGGRRARKF
jgi:hypothetical protein